MNAPPTPLWAVNALTFLASIGTGVVWAGIPFIAKHEYGYTARDNLILYAVLGVMYVLGAATSGAVLRRIGRRIVPRSFIGALLALGALVSLVPLIFRGGWTLWVVACTVNVLSSWLWPVVESYLTAGRHGDEMRRAIGRFNLTWTSAVSVSLLLMAPLIEKRASLALVVVGLFYLPALGVLRAFEPRPGAHDEAAASGVVAPEYPLLLRAARTLLPLSYVLNSAMNALLPYALVRLHVPPFWETPAAAAWTIARIAVMAAMGHVRYWHGRWGTLLAGGLTMTAGFGGVVAGGSLPALLAGLALLGGGMGIVYYAALYYGMAVGRADVDAGGKHEALIGAGYAVGPMAGLFAMALSDAASRRGFAVDQGTVVIAVVWTLIALCSLVVLRPYRTARRLRRGNSGRASVSGR